MVKIRSEAWVTASAAHSDDLLPAVLLDPASMRASHLDAPSDQEAQLGIQAAQLSAWEMILVGVIVGVSIEVTKRGFKVGDVMRDQVKNRVSGLRERGAELRSQIPTVSRVVKAQLTSAEWDGELVDESLTAIGYFCNTVDEWIRESDPPSGLRRACEQAVVEYHSSGTARDLKKDHRDVDQMQAMLRFQVARARLDQAILDLRQHLLDSIPKKWR